MPTEPDPASTGKEPSRSAFPYDGDAWPTPTEVTRLAVEAELSQNLASGRCGASLWGFGLNAGQHELGAVVWAIDGDVTVERGDPLMINVADRTGKGCRVEFTFDSVGSKGRLCRPLNLGGCDYAMIILGIVLLVIGFIAAIPVIWSIGVIVLIIGLVFMIFGALGHAIGGRRHVF
jgi:type IV secretory pathway TrbD component